MASDPLQLLIAQGGGNPYLASVQGQQGLQAGQQQLDIGALQLKAAQQQQQQAQSYQQDVESYFKDPKPERLAGLIAKYPQQADALKQSKAALDEPARQSQLTQYGQLYNAASAGRTDLLIKQATALKTAEAAQGIDTSEIDDVLGRLQSSDPAAQKEATKQILALSQVHIAALDPKFADSLTSLSKGKDGYTLNPGDVRFDAENHPVASVDPKPLEPKYEKMDVYDGQGHVIGQKLVDVSTGGGGQASGATGGSSGSTANAPRRSMGWTPRARDGGDNPDNVVDAKLAAISKATGLDIDAPLTPQQAAKVIAAIPATEGGAGSIAERNNNPGNIKFGGFARSQGATKDPHSGYAVFPTAQAGMQAAQRLGQGYYARGQRTIRDIIEGKPVGGSTAPAPAGGPRVVMDTTAAGGGAPVDIKPGDISTVPAQMRGAVQAIAEGRAAAPRPGTRNGEAMLDAVTAFDPTWDSTLQPLRLQAAKQFTGQGSGAQIAASGNRLAYHLNDLWRDSKALSGPDLGWNPLSTLAAHTAQSFQGAAVARYNAVLPFISGELQKLTKNGHITEGETKNIMANLAPGQASANREAAIQQVAELAQGQFKPFRDQWVSAFGPDKRPPVDFTPTTQKIFDHITAGQDPLTIDHNGMIVGEKRAQAAPVKVSTPGQAAALPSGTLFQTPDGRTLRKR